MRVTMVEKETGMGKPRFIYIHGNGTIRWAHGWAVWLQAGLAGAGYDTFFETMPDSIIARAEYGCRSWRLKPKRGK